MITHLAHLPAIGSAESVSMDFKVTYKRSDGFDRFELAKDVAALANAVGGALLIGAQEDRATGTLRSYVPMADSDVKATAVAIEEAVRDRCSPMPVFSIARIAKDNGTVLAVNVTAYPGQPVGVSVRGDKGDGYGDPAWTFPVRVGTQTNFFRPEQLAMLMSAEYRRIVILLSAIVAGEKVLVTWPDRGFGGEPEFAFVSLSAQDNLVALQPPDPQQATMRLPLDAIRSVWRDGPWYLFVQGHFMPRNVAGKTVVEFWRT